MNTALLILEPLLDTLMTELLIPAVMLYLAYLAHRFLGVKLDEKAEGKVKRAIETGWKRAMAENFDDPSIKTVVEHVETIGAKDSVKRLKLSPNDIAAMAPAQKVSARQRWLKDAT